MKRFKIARWWTFIYAIILLISIMLIISGSIGANGIRYRGNSVFIDRSSDYRLYRVDSRHALYLLPGKEEISLVTYKKEKLFRFLGDFSYDGEVFTQVCKNGNWLYAAHAGFVHPGRPIAYHYKSGQMLNKEEPLQETLGYTPANMAAVGLECKPKFRLRPQQLSEFPELSVPRESSITITMALAALHIFWFLVLPFAIKRIKI